MSSLPWSAPPPERRAAVMGVINVTPDSFSDGGLFHAREAAVARALAMAEAGAGIVDIGGESTRPGAVDVALDEELARTIGVIEGIRLRSDVPISIDTSKAAVMREAVAAGASLINDVQALRAEGALEAAAASGAAVCLMHMRGTPRTMQGAPEYDDVVAEVLDFLRGRVAACEAAGIDRGRLLIDPGFGFGKTADHNLQLLRGLGEFVSTGLPVLAGLSRKSLLQALTGRPVDERLAGSVALATLAAWHGARVIRAHDVAATLDAVKVAHAVRNAGADSRG